MLFKSSFVLVTSLLTLANAHSPIMLVSNNVALTMQDVGVKRYLSFDTTLPIAMVENEDKFEIKFNDDTISGGNIEQEGQTNLYSVFLENKKATDAAFTYQAGSLTYGKPENKFKFVSCKRTVDKKSRNFLMLVKGDLTDDSCQVVNVRSRVYGIYYKSPDGRQVYYG